jgi:uncharacterized protein (DUF1015 family)
MHAGEVRRTIGENPLSFLRITRSEAEFGDDERPAPQKVYERSRSNLQQFIDRGIFFTENEPSLYVYRLKDGDHVQTGVVGCCSLDEYESGSIKKHEKTRPDKVKDRTEHLLAVRAQTGLILLAFRGTADIYRLIDEAVQVPPIYDFECAGDVQHTFWRVTKTDDLVKAFAEVPSLYIADGHHRVESADLARKKLRDANASYSGNEEYNYLLAGIFPAEDLRILAYNRFVTEMNGLEVSEFLARVEENFEVNRTGAAVPKAPGEIAIYLNGNWYTFTLKAGRIPTRGTLDVSILHDLILRPILGIEDERTDERIAFVGGKDSTQRLKQMVDSGRAKIAFSLYPTSMESLLEVSDRDEIMPPKSTWFDPKLKDGILIHLI